MVSPARKRQAVCFLLDRGFSRVCACRVSGLSRPASRRTLIERNPGLREKVFELARANPRYGFRRVHALLTGVNLKAVHRIWKAHGLNLRHRKRRKLVVPKAEGIVLSMPNQAWCLDFCHERLENGRHVRILGVLDCFTRECLLLKAASSFPAYEVAKEIQWLCLVHGKPERVLSDNGPEFRAMKLPEGVSNRFIQPGKPWQNGYIESFFGKLRDELLSMEIFTRGAELQSSLQDFQEHYNNHRPHLGLRGLPPQPSRKVSRQTNQRRKHYNSRLERNWGLVSMTMVLSAFSHPYPSH